MEKRGQVAIEYITILGFVLVTTLVMTYLFTQHTGTLNDAVIEHQVERIAEKIVDTAEAMYFLGEPSRTNIKLYFPLGILNASANGQEIVFLVETSHGHDEVVKYSQVNITGTIPTSPGIHYLQVEAQGNRVVLS
ncbi:MAG TPA: hypothetical protein VLJ21_03020 [Candidatus Binatia bacterium]|nr:hypothetical protein [Candidatus Binatia bacterium]